ncbi:hypothetical protein [Luteimicrobium sp. DT211]|uniref:hypothetical protein n=1 Tax=Luteimicrobium sp. DT211 TaxID=3393412 RepID=UPI003CEB2634
MSAPGDTTPVPVLCAVRGPAEARVATTLAADPGTVVVRRCADVAELLAASAAGLGAVAVVSGDLTGLDRAAVAALHEAAVRVVVLHDDVAYEEQRVRALGPDRVLALRAALDDDATLAATVRDALRDPARPDTGALPQLEDAPLVRRSGSVVVVWGPTGAPGRSTVAVNLAAELAGAGRRAGRRRVPVDAGVEVLLADADTYGGVVAQLLGMLDESVGLAAASRAAAQGVLDAVALARLSPYVLARLRVLTGITRPARWVELPGSSLDVVWERAREVADVTVVDCGFSLEHDELLTYDTRAPQRNAATLSALGAADVVVVVGGADPVGIQRLVRALGDLDDAGVLAPRVVVANRVRGRAAGARPAQAVGDVLARYAGVDSPVLLPDDPAACDRAVLEGRVIAECAPSSAVRSALTALAGTVRTLLPVRDAGDGAVVGGPVRREALERAH